MKNTTAALVADAPAEIDLPGLRLLPGEQLVRESAPSGVLRLRLLAISTFFCVLGVFTIPLLPLAWWAALRSVAVHRYWLTDRRLVVRTGLIGYQLRSVPLSRVVDVSAKASWFDRLLGLTDVEVRDMTGESSSDTMSQGLKLQGVPLPDDWVDAILARSGGSLESGGTQLDRVVHLLEQLVRPGAPTPHRGDGRRSRTRA